MGSSQKNWRDNPPEDWYWDWLGTLIVVAGDRPHPLQIYAAEWLIERGYAVPTADPGRVSQYVQVTEAGKEAWSIWRVTRKLQKGW